MFAPAQKMRSCPEVMTTALTAGWVNRSLCSASASSMSTERSYELLFNSYAFVCGSGPEPAPPSSTSESWPPKGCTFMVSRATSPSTARVQCR